MLPRRHYRQGHWNTTTLSKHSCKLTRGAQLEGPVLICQLADVDEGQEGVQDVIQAQEPNEITTEGCDRGQTARVSEGGGGMRALLLPRQPDSAARSAAGVAGNRRPGRTGLAR